MAVGLIYPDEAMPLTVFYDTVRKIVQARGDFSQTLGSSDLAFLHEDLTAETNWPRYGRQESALVRGAFDDLVYTQYLGKVLESPVPVCVICMQAYIMPHAYIVQNPNFILADGCLTTADRALNPRTISMPALPLVSGQCDVSRKKRLASFRGAANHPVRQALTELNTIPGFCCEVIEKGGYHGKIDALGGVTDGSYADLLDESLFAIIPRGFEHFSYRLLEAMSFGCIPIILSDGWVLPFDRTIPWREMSLHIPENAYHRIPDLIARLSPETIFALQNKVVQVYQGHLSSLEVIIDRLIGEATMILDATPSAPS